jgi:hypothetical protein
MAAPQANGAESYLLMPSGFIDSTGNTAFTLFKSSLPLPG